eukprot:scaffold128050_cov48-Phaeocystis_antarctica.AAC.1
MEGWRDRLTGGWINRWAAIHLERAALHGRRRAPRAVGVDCALGEAVLLGVGVDESGDRAVGLGVHGLESTEALAVPHEGHLAAHVDARRLERGEVFGEAEVGVHHGRLHAAARAIAVEGVVTPPRVARRVAR